MTFESRINERDLYRFQIHQAYHGTQGWSALVLAVLAAVMSIRTYGNVSIGYTGLYLIFSLVFLVYIPMSLKMQSARQFKSHGVLRQTMNFELDDEGVRLHIEEQEDILPWARVYLVKETKDYIYIFSSRVYAYIVPKRCIQDQKAEILSYMKDHLAPERMKIKA